MRNLETTLSNIKIILHINQSTKINFKQSFPKNSQISILTGEPLDLNHYDPRVIHLPFEVDDAIR